MRTLKNQLREYGSFVLEETVPLSYGMNFTFLSSFGQTFLISLFVPHFVEVFDLTKASFGTIYSALTLISAASIPVLGGWIDRSPLTLYSTLVLSGLIAGALLSGLAGHVAVLVVGLFLLRLCGQGLSNHTAHTSIGRFYDEKRRGKALSIINLGLPVGEGILPLIVTGLLAWISWRWTLVGIGLLIALVFLPTQYLLMKGSRITDPRWSASEGETTDDSTGYFGFRQFRVYVTILREPRFWLISPAVVLPAFWITGLFLYQTTLADRVGWTLGLLATAFVAYAVCRIAFSLGIGPAVDRWNARILFPFYLVPFGLALLFAYFHPGRWSAFAYMSLLGVTMGAGSSIKTALWAELYGRNILGRIRSLFSALMVFSTSLSPFLLGWLLDHRYSFETIILWALATIFGATATATVGLLADPASKSLEE